MVATEIALIPVKAGTNLADTNTSAGRTWQDIYRTVSSQDGFQEAWYGHEVETPTNVQLFVNWANVEDHHKFIKSREYGPMVESIKTLLDGELKLFHVEFSSAQAQRVAFGAPVTELATFHTQSKSTELSENAQKFAEIVAKDANGFVAAASGWSIEDVEHEKLDGKGKVFFLAVGWDSYDLHMAYRESESFKNNISLLRHGVESVEMHHVKMISPEGSAPPRVDDDPRIGTVSGKEQP